ncbi:MAG: hypothetical protein WAZ77_22475 [Candidatus Nitrosopolaris sp.]|jgi:hypothetical protein
MAWLLDITRAEKEQYVIELYKQNRTVREIAKLMHMSFGEIGKILKKFKKEAEIERGHTDVEEIDNEPKSKESQAFKLFSEGKTPVQVVIALDIQADEVHAIYREYLELKGMYDVLQIYDKIRYSGKYSLPSFLKLHRIVNDLGMGEQQIINVLDLANHNQLEYLQDKVEYLRNEINNLDLKKTECTNHVLTLNKRVDDLTEIVNMYESSLKEKMEEIAFLNLEQKRLDNLFANNNGNKNDEGIEVVYATGSCHNLNP